MCLYFYLFWKSEKGSFWIWRKYAFSWTRRFFYLFFLVNKSVDCDFSLPLQWSKLMVTVQESYKCKWKLKGKFYSGYLRPSRSVGVFGTCNSMNETCWVNSGKGKRSVKQWPFYPCGQKCQVLKSSAEIGRILIIWSQSAAHLLADWVKWIRRTSLAFPLALVLKYSLKETRIQACFPPFSSIQEEKHIQVSLCLQMQQWRNGTE